MLDLMGRLKCVSIRGLQMDPQRQNSPERMVEMGTVGPLRRISPTLLVWGGGRRSDQWELRLGGGCC